MEFPLRKLLRNTDEVVGNEGIKDKAKPFDYLSLYIYRVKPEER
jgi:hypothetical protein